ncbi:hypothetical protein ACFVKB_32235 [Rhodococcus sp. NPDC127530]
MANTDVSVLLSCGILTDIEVFGDAPSAVLLEKLSGFGSYTLRTALTSN